MPKIAAPAEWFRGTCGIESTEVFARARERNVHETGFVARPARSVFAEAGFHIGEIRARISPSILAGLPPERKPLSGMAVGQSVCGTEAHKHNRPDRHEQADCVGSGSSDRPIAAGSKKRNHLKRATRSIPLIERFSSGTCRSLS